MNDTELQQILAQLRDDPVPVPTVRHRVLAHLGRTRRIRRLSMWTAVAAAAALIFVTFAPPEPLNIPPPPAPIVAALPPPAISKSVRVTEQRRRAGRPKPVPPSETLTVKLLTGDPDVVIYWIVEGQGE